VIPLKVLILDYCQEFKVDVMNKAYFPPTLEHLSLGCCLNLGENLLLNDTGGFPHLQVLDLRQTKFDDSDLIRIIRGDKKQSNLPQLHTLQLESVMTLKGDFLPTLAENCPKLKKLYMPGCRHIAQGDPNFSCLRSLSSLEELDVSACGGVSVALFKNLEPLIFTRLTVNQTTLSKTDLLASKDMPCIKKCFARTLRSFEFREGLPDSVGQSTYCLNDEYAFY